MRILIDPVLKKNYDLENGYLDMLDLKIGRASGCDIPIDLLRGTGVSRIHAALVKMGEGLWGIIDLCSENGTYVDGKRLKPYSRPLKLTRQRHEIKLGDYLLKFLQQPNAED